MRSVIPSVSVLALSVTLGFAMQPAGADAQGAFVLHDEEVDCYLPEVDANGEVTISEVAAGKATLVSPPSSDDLVMICSGDTVNESNEQVRDDCVQVCVTSATALVCTDETNCQCDYHVNHKGNAHLRCHFRE